MMLNTMSNVDERDFESFMSIYDEDENYDRLCYVDNHEDLSARDSCPDFFGEDIFDNDDFLY